MAKNAPSKKNTVGSKKPNGLKVKKSKGMASLSPEMKANAMRAKAQGGVKPTRTQKAKKNAKKNTRNALASGAGSYVAGKKAKKYAKQSDKASAKADALIAKGRKMRKSGKAAPIFGAGADEVLARSGRAARASEKLERKAGMANTVRAGGKAGAIGFGAVAAYGAGAQFYTRMRRGKMEKVRKGNRSRQG